MNKRLLQYTYIFVSFLMMTSWEDSVLGSMRSDEAAEPVITSRQAAIRALKQKSVEGGISDISQLSSQYQYHGVPQDDVVVPVPPFQLKSLEEEPKEFRERLPELQQAYESDSIYFFHGLRDRSLRRVYGFHYKDPPNDLTTLFRHSIYLSLGARLLTSSCILDLNAPRLRVFAACGFIYKVPVQAMYCAYDGDAYVPKEGDTRYGRTPKDFRNLALEETVIENPQARKEYNAKLSELKLRQIRGSNALECAVEKEIIAAQTDALDAVSREITELELKYSNDPLYPKVRVFKRNSRFRPLKLLLKKVKRKLRVFLK